MTHKEYAHPWKRMAEAWKLFGKGNHPSEHDIEAYEKYFLKAIEGKTNPKVLILGATCEIRDMLAKYVDVSVTLLDISEDMIEALGSLMTRKTDNEKWVEGDWLDAPFEDNYFDAVFGDQVKSNISIDNYQKFYSEIQRVLKPSGYHISRITSRFPHTKIFSVEEIIEKYSQIPVSKESLTEFWNLLIFNTHNDPVSSTNRIFNILDTYKSKGYLAEYDEILRRVLPKNKDWSVGRSWDEEKEYILEFFNIIDQEQDDTVFADSTYIYLLKSKKK